LRVSSEDFDRFTRSLNIGYVEWHDGVPYDLESLARLTGKERDEAERLILARNAADWRDLQALDRLGSPAAIGALVTALDANRVEIRVAAAELLAARALLDETRIEGIILAALDTMSITDGLTRTFRLAQAHPTPAVRRRLLSATVDGNEDIRVHAAALTHFLYGGSSSPFDWKHREFYLRFASGARHERLAAYADLCHMIGIDSAPGSPPEEGAPN
jgi:hypothetical protein